MPPLFPSRSFLLLTLLCSLPALTPPAGGAEVPGPESTLLLTWFEDPTTTMVVQWISDGHLPPRADGSAARTAWSVPEAEGELVMDGDPDDWADAGLRTDHIPLPDGGWPDATGTMASVRTAWTPEGLAVFADVADDDPLGLPMKRREGRTQVVADRVEMRLTGADPEAGSFRIQVGLPVEPGGPASVAVVNDVEEAGPTEPAAGIVLTAKGYAVEAMLPWAAIPGLVGETGTPLGLQVEVFDADDRPTLSALSWAGYAYPRQAWRRVAPLVLSGPGRVDPVRARVEARRPANPEGGERERVLAIGGEPRLIGETVTVRSGDVVLADVVLDDVQGFAGAELMLGGRFAGAMPEARLDTVTVELDGAIIAREVIDPTYWAVAPEAGRLTAIEGEHAPDEIPAPSIHSFAGSGWFVHRTVLTGLDPGTDYAVAVPGRLAPVRFRTAPATLDEPMVFAEGGDVGASREVGELHDEAAAWDPLFGLVGGDCAYGNGLDPIAWLQYLRLWNDHMTPADGRSVPMVCSVGNHETIGNRSGKKPEDAPFFRDLFGPTFSARGAYGVLDFGGDPTDGGTPYLSLYLLDSGHSAPHGTHQLDWLVTALAERKTVEHQLVAYHVPAYPSVRDPNGGDSSSARKNWVPLFEQQPIDLVFEHHDHAYKRTHPLRGGEAHPDGVLYLGDGCWGRSPRKVDPTRPYLALALSERNVMRVTLNPDGTRAVLAVNEHGEVLDEMELARGPAPELAAAGSADRE